MDENIMTTWWRHCNRQTAVVGAVVVFVEWPMSAAAMPIAFIVIAAFRARPVRFFVVIFVFDAASFLGTLVMVVVVIILIVAAAFVFGLRLGVIVLVIVDFFFCFGPDG